MNDLHDRINRIINSECFEAYLEEHGSDLFEFQTSWARLSDGHFDQLPPHFKQAIWNAEAASAQPVGLELAGA